MDVSHSILFSVILTGILIAAFGFSNGFRDSATIVATVVSTRALSPRAAFFWCAILEFAGALLLGKAVVATVGKKIILNGVNISPYVMLLVVDSALLAAIVWGVISWWQAWPISNNQALLSGFVGAVAAALGFKEINYSVMAVVFLVLIISPLIAFLLSLFITKIIRSVGEWMTVKVRPYADKLHVIFCLLVSCAHGSNDGQIMMALFLLAFGSALGTQNDVPVPVRLFVAFCIGFGVLMGGNRLLKKIGMRFYQIQPTQGLGAQMTSALTILTCSTSGFPASAMQVITGSVVGAGAAKTPKSVRWHIAKEVVFSWFITLPIVGGLAFCFCSILLRMAGLS